MLGNKNYSKQHKKKLNVKLLKLHKNIFHSWEFAKPWHLIIMCSLAASVYTQGLDFRLSLGHKIMGSTYIWTGSYMSIYIYIYI